MSRLKLAVSICVPLILLLSANTAGAAMLFVNCGAKTGLTSIGAALKVVQGGSSKSVATSPINASMWYQGFRPNRRTTTV